MININRKIVFFIAALLCLGHLSAQEATARSVLPAKKGGRKVPADVMQGIYETVKTPFKYGIVLKGEKGKKVDCPSVFRHGDQWYMVYITFDGQGYETEIAVSHDLLEWKPLGKVLSFQKDTWDAIQSAILPYRIIPGQVRMNWRNTIIGIGCRISEEIWQAMKPIR